MRLLYSINQGRISSLESDLHCNPGETFKQQCNTCVCSDDGKYAACTAMGCIDWKELSPESTTATTEEPSTTTEPTTTEGTLEHVESNNHVCTPNDVKLEVWAHFVINFSINFEAWNTHWRTATDAVAQQTELDGSVLDEHVRQRKFRSEQSNLPSPVAILVSSGMTDAITVFAQVRDLILIVRRDLTETLQTMPFPSAQWWLALSDQAHWNSGDQHLKWKQRNVNRAPLGDKTAIHAFAVAQVTKLNKCQTISLTKLKYFQVLRHAH